MTYLYSSINRAKNDLYVLKLGRPFPHRKVPLSTHPGRCVAGSDWQTSAHPQQAATSCFLRISVGSNEANSKSDPPPPKKKMESNNKKTLPGCPPSFRWFFDTNIHKVKVCGTSKSFLHLVASLSPGWLDLKTWEQWQHCCFACVLRCQLFLLQLLIHLRKVVEFDTRGFFWDPWQTNWLQYLYIYIILTKHMMR